MGALRLSQLGYSYDYATQNPRDASFSSREGRGNDLKDMEHSESTVQRAFSANTAVLVNRGLDAQRSVVAKEDTWEKLSQYADLDPNYWRS